MVESHDALDAAARRAKVAEGARDDAARRAERAEARLAAEEERAGALDLANHGLSARVKEVEGERDEAATKLTAAAFDAEEGRRRVHHEITRGRRRRGALPGPGKVLQGQDFAGSHGRDV